MKVVLATARDRASIAAAVPLDRPGLYHLACGGAMVHEPASKATLWAATMLPALAADAVTFLQRFDEPVFLNADCQYWVDRGGTRVAMIERRYDLRTRPFARLEDVPVPVMRASLAAPRPVLEQAAQEASAAFGDRASVSLASPDWLDVLGPAAGKGRALAWLQARTGVGADETWQSATSILTCPSSRRPGTASRWRTASRASELPRPTTPPGTTKTAWRWCWSGSSRSERPEWLGHDPEAGAGDRRRLDRLRAGP